VRILGLTGLEVQVLNGALILTAKDEAPQPPAESEVVAQLRKACKKLSPRKQEQIAPFITAVSTPQKRPWRNGKVEWRAV